MVGVIFLFAIKMGRLGVSVLIQPSRTHGHAQICLIHIHVHKDTHVMLSSNIAIEIFLEKVMHRMRHVLGLVTLLHILIISVILIQGNVMNVLRGTQLDVVKIKKKNVPAVKRLKHSNVIDLIGKIHTVLNALQVNQVVTKKT